jgi:hypothetical protein
MSQRSTECRLAGACPEEPLSKSLTTRCRPGQRRRLHPSTACGFLVRKPQYTWMTDCSVAGKFGSPHSLSRSSVRPAPSKCIGLHAAALSPSVSHTVRLKRVDVRESVFVECTAGVIGAPVWRCMSCEPGSRFADRHDPVGELAGASGGAGGRAASKSGMSGLTCGDGRQWAQVRPLGLPCGSLPAGSALVPRPGQRDLAVRCPG